MCRSLPSPIARAICALAVPCLGLVACEDSVAPRPAKPVVSATSDGTPAFDGFSARPDGFTEASLAGRPGRTFQHLGITAAARVPGTTSPDRVVLPNAFAQQMGITANTFPHAAANMRYQQVFLESELAGLRAVGGLCLRRDEQFGGPAQVQQLTVKLGPTARDHTNLGPVFDENYSAAPVTVFSGPVTLPASTGGGTPNDFNICMDFGRSYVHTSGRNILVEIVNTSAGSVPHFDDACVGTPNGCTTARAWAFGATAASAVFVDNMGLVMTFVRSRPATKDDCKDDGWENYGFVNQGQCVRFIETGVDSR